MRTTLGALSLSLTVLCFTLFATPVASQENPKPMVGRASAFAVSAPLRDLVAPSNHLGQAMATFDRAQQLAPAPSSNFAVSSEFLGLGNGFPNFTVLAEAPDANLAVGSTQIVQWANIEFAVFNKSTGALESGPISSSTLWASIGGACMTGSNASTELIVQWDRAHQRWLLSQNTMTQSPYYSCVAVSTSADATGSYYVYAFPQGSLISESPKWGVWSNGYYQSQGVFSNSGYVGPELCAYNSAKLIAGDRSAEQICFTLSPADGLPLPADIDSNLAPPANEDEFFMSLWDVSHLSLYSLHPDYQDPQSSTVTGNNGSQLITVPRFTPACNGAYGGNCVPQKNGSSQLQVLGDRLLFRLAYWEDTPDPIIRPIPPIPPPLQHWYVVHDSTAPGGNEAPRWYEFGAPVRTVPVTAIGLLQSGTFAPDTNYRWMGSIARDKVRDLLLGYSESSSSMYPSIAITGRVLNDPLGTMENEFIVQAGDGAQVGTPWGNFSSMRIDLDGCTFWYTNEYYMATLARDWSTEIASARFSGCH